jgi:hypothetical protein
VQLFEGNVIVTFATVADDQIANGDVQSGLQMHVAATASGSLCVPMKY